jgi:hypothetical protein
MVNMDLVALDDGEEELLEAPSLWEAEMSALDDEQLLALVDSAEDG